MQTGLDAGLFAVLLIILLVAKELASASLRHKWRNFARYLNVALVPMLIVFLFNIAQRVIELLW